MTSTDYIPSEAATRPPQDFEPLFEPRVVAVAGASTSGNAQGNAFLRQLRDAGFDGEIVAIHPRATSIDGYPAVPSLADAPEPIDYAYVSVPSPAVPSLIAAGKGRVRFAQVISSGFGEGDGAGKELADALLSAARDAGTRIIGPNSLGTHSPRGRMSYVGGADVATGTVSVASQSGGLSVDMVRRGRSLGVHFRSVVSVGNALDVDPIELLEYYLTDPGTRVIGLYLEHVSDGRRFINALRRAAMAKPIVILKGGLTEQGNRAAASHTGAAATDERLWRGLAAQFGMVLTETTDEFLHALLGFQSFSPRRQPRWHSTVLFGNGGGVNVLASDQFARAGFSVPPLSEAVQAEAHDIEIPPGASTVNPIDLPAGVFAHNTGQSCADLLRLVLERERPGSVVVHLNLGAMLQGPTYMDGFKGFLTVALPLLKRHQDVTIPALVLNSDGGVEAEEVRRELMRAAQEHGIPAFGSFAGAIHLLTAIQAHEVRLDHLAAPNRHVDAT